METICRTDGPTVDGALGSFSHRRLQSLFACKVGCAEAVNQNRASGVHVPSYDEPAISFPSLWATTTLRRPDTRRPRRLAWDAHHSLCANRQPCADGKTHADGKREDGQPALRRRERPTVVAATLGMCDLDDAADPAKCKRPAPCSQCTTATAFIQNIVCREEEEWKIFVIPLPPPQKMSKRLAKSVLYH